MMTPGQFWATYLATLPNDHSHRHATYVAWGFGDSPQMANELGQLVRSGTKKATAGLWWDYEHDNEPVPQNGQLNIILDGNRLPLCITETTEVIIKPFNEVDAQFAYDEGEGDRSLDYWRRVHWAFFSRVCTRIGREPTETMSVVCERFIVVYKLTTNDL